MKSKILAVLSIIYIYIYTIATPCAWALSDATSFSPEKVQVQAQSIGVPVGTVIVWTKNAVPDGWLECNGQKVNKALYPDLAALMSNVPNYQGMFLRGVGSQSHTKHNGDRIGVTETFHKSGSLGQIQGDSTREWYFKAAIVAGWLWAGEGIANWGSEMLGPDGGRGGYHVTTYNPKMMVPTANEIRPVNVGVKYIIKAE